MNELEKLYTVEDIANMTGLTTRTIRNYLRNGKLEGKKIGGQWRFTIKNIENLFDNSTVSRDIKDNKKQLVLDFIEGANKDLKASIQTCTIVDYYCDNVEVIKQLSDKLMTVMNSNNEENYGDAKYYYEYVEEERKARFTLFGNPTFIINILKLLE